MLSWILLIALQIALVVHAARNNHIWWIFLILFFPLIGGIAYFFLAVLPDLRESRALKDASTKVARGINPKGELNKSLDALKVADTPANRVNAAREFMALEMYGEAVKMYESAVLGVFSDDPPMLFGLATAYYYDGQYEKAKEALNKTDKAGIVFKVNERALLYAMVLEAIGDTEEALKEFQDVSRRFVGPEAKVRYAVLLKKTGDKVKADEILAEIRSRAKQMPRHYRKFHKEWLDAAKRELG